MRIIPVIDLKAGLVVRGIAGNRQAYQPIQSRIVSTPAPGEVAQALSEKFKPLELYVADLDAIAGGEPDWASYRQIAARGVALWIDAGVANLSQIQRLLEFAAQERVEAHAILGLESAPDSRFLHEAVAALDASSLIFSLDLREGRPMTQSAAWSGMSAEAIAHEAASAGIDRMIVLDVAQVGTGRGPGALSLCRRLSEAHRHVELIGGGGVRSIDDLIELGRAGCAAALVASALHDERIAAAASCAIRRK